MILVTGSAGFIGYHVAEALLARGDAVLGIDNLNDYYDVALKEARLARLETKKNFFLRRADISERAPMLGPVSEFPEFTGIFLLAVKAVVRHSLVNPYVYVQSNVLGQVVMIELARACAKLRHFVYASSSSVYGGNKKMPFAIEDPV